MKKFVNSCTRTAGLNPFPDGCGASSKVTDVVVPKTKLDLDQGSNVQTLLRDGGYRTGVTPLP